MTYQPANPELFEAWAWGFGIAVALLILRAIRPSLFSWRKQ